MLFCNMKERKRFACHLFTVNADLFSSGYFEKMELGTDEDEHSIEMQLPYVAKVMER